MTALRLRRPRLLLGLPSRTAAVTLSLLLAVTAGCGGASHAPASDTGWSPAATEHSPAVMLDIAFDDPLTDAATLQRITSDGEGAYEIDVVTSGAGRLVTQPGRRAGLDRAARFPAFDPHADGARALIRVVPAAGSSDDLDPGTRDFVFGADVWLDATSQSLGGADDGNNVVQRGLYADPSQYKLEIDEGVPSCRVKGSTGDLEATSTSPLDPGHWYRLRCARKGENLTLTVIGWTSQGAATKIQSAERGLTGDLTPPNRGLALSVGGKLSSDDSTIEPQSDQFNGLIDNVVLEIA